MEEVNQFICFILCSYPNTIIIPIRVNIEPKSRFKKIENANYAVELCKTVLKFSMVNVGGVDIVDGRKKMILSIIWQMIHKSILDLLADLAKSQGISEMSEDVIVRWANRKVSDCTQ